MSDADSPGEAGKGSGGDAGTFPADSASDSPTTREATSCTLSAPVVSPAPATYLNVVTVTVTDPNATPGDQIFYTIDGSTPTAHSFPYTGPITLSASAVVKAIVVNPSCSAASPVTLAVYSVMFSQNPPLTCAEQGITCGPAGDGFGGLLECGTCTPPAACGGGGVAGQCGTPSEMDGCAPQTCGALGIACGPATDGCGGMLDCGACPGLDASADGDGCANGAYVPDVGYMPPGLLGYTAPIIVTLSDADPEAVIHYTLDGTIPSVASTIYTAPITLTKTTTVNVIAIDACGNHSAWATNTYGFGP